MIIQNGDIYKLGDHVLGCGSSTDKDFVDKVIGDKKIRCVICDPPYGIAYVEGKKNLNQKLGVNSDKAIIGDQLQTDEEYSEFTKKISRDN
jgi:16S rRNA G966 N2-methylase RsmD